MDMTQGHEKVVHYSHAECKFDISEATLHGTQVAAVVQNIPTDHRFVTSCLSGQHATRRVNGDVVEALTLAMNDVHRKAAIQYSQQLRPTNQAKEPKRNTLGQSLLERM